VKLNIREYILKASKVAVTRGGANQKGEMEKGREALRFPISALLSEKKKT